MLTVSDLACARGGLPVLSGVSFTLMAGGAMVLRGPNGVGKTTLLRTIAGLQPPLAGKIDAPEGAVAYGGHADGIKAQLTVAENLEFWAGIYGHTRGIGAALAAFDLHALRLRLGQNLSAGQKRRLGLARLLVTDRPVWALDEPTVSLDRASVALFVRALAEHRGAGGAALIATHIDLGMEADTLDLEPYRAVTLAAEAGDFEEAFL